MTGTDSSLFMGIDVGTQSARVGLCDIKGNLICTASKAYKTRYPQPGWAEQDSNDWWQSICQASRECIQKINLNSHVIEGISFDATSSTVLMVDREGNPLDQAILWMDQRAVKEVEEIQKTNHPYLKYVGGQNSVEWMVPKAMWLKRNKSQQFKKAFRIIEATDWIAYKLSGNWTVSLCNATCKWNYVSREGGWDQGFFSELGLPDILSKWPERVVPMGEKIGILTSQAASELGLPDGIPISEGGIDAHVGLLGLNALESTTLGLIIGSSNVIFVLHDQPVFSKEFWGPYPDAVIEDKWLIEGGQTSSGSIINWLVDNINWVLNGDSRSKQRILAKLEEEIDSIPACSKGLILLDYWQGNRTPRRDPTARGIIFGLTLGHDIRHLVRSMYEGISFGTRHIIESLRSNGISIKSASAGGGGVKSKIWLKLTADICDIAITVPRFADSCGLIGCAICAACGSGVYNSIPEAADHMVSAEEKILPTGDSKSYDEAFKKYLELYESTKHLL